MRLPHRPQRSRRESSFHRLESVFWDRLRLTTHCLLLSTQNGQQQALPSWSDQEAGSLSSCSEIVGRSPYSTLGGLTNVDLQLLEDPHWHLRCLVPVRLRHFPQRCLFRRHHFQPRQQKREYDPIDCRMATSPRNHCFARSKSIDTLPDRIMLISFVGAHRSMALQQNRQEEHYDSGVRRVPRLRIDCWGSL